MFKSIETRIISALLIAYGSYNIWAIYLTGDYWFLLWVIACFTGAIGLVLSMSWSQYFVYLVSLFIIGGWLYITFLIALNGWPYSGTIETLISLLPGIILSMVCVLSSIYVFRNFGNVTSKT